MLHCQGEPHIEVGAGSSASDSAREAGKQAALAAKASVHDQPLALALVFASVRYDLEELIAAVADELGEVPLIGGTTAGEIHEGLQHGSVTVMLVASRHFKVRVGVGAGASEDWLRATDEAVAALNLSELERGDSAYWRDLRRSGRAAFGLLFSPGNTRDASSMSYEILEEIKRRTLGRVPIAGGSTADDWRMERSFVFCGRRIIADGVLFALCETHLRFGLGMAHGFEAGRRRATVTRARGHEVQELDGRKAVEVYPELLGRDRKELEGRHVTLESARPAGVPYRYGQYSINVASFFTPEGGLLFTQPLAEGATLTLMNAPAESLVRAGADAARKALLRGSITDPAVVVVFSCALRDRILRERSIEEVRRIEALFPGVPVVGFSSFGEQGVTDDGVNEHNNAIVSVLVVGKQLTQAAEVALENQRLALERASDRERLALALEGANLGMWDWQVKSGEVVYDQRWSHMLGFEDTVPPRKVDSWDGLLHPDDIPKLAECMSNHLAGETEAFELEHRLKHRDGRWIWVLARGKVVERDAEGKPVRVCGTNLDITQRKRSEEELRGFAETQAVLVREANHRVKNNLVAVLGMLRLEQSREPSQERSQDSELARRLVGRIEGLSAVHSLLTSMGWKELPLPQLCERVVHVGLKGVGGEVRVNVGDCDLTVDSNTAHQLALLLIELVTNTAKYAFPHVASPQIEIEAACEDDEVLLTYRDNGPGHPPDMLAGLRESRGIGTEIVEGITHMLRGQVVFENDQGAVTKLRFKRGHAVEELS